jgi:hypothetical protein
VKDVAKSEVSNVATEAKYQARNLVDQTRSQLRDQTSNQQSQLASRLSSWAHLGLAQEPMRVEVQRHIAAGGGDARLAALKGGGIHQVKTTRIPQCRTP